MWKEFRIFKGSGIFLVYSLEVMDGDIILNKNESD